MANARRNGRLGQSILIVGLMSLGLTASAYATSRSATTTVAVRVERHVGLVLPTSNNGLVFASLGRDPQPTGPTAFGNGTSRILLSRPSGAALRPAAMQSSPDRVEITVFEP
jgi:hypothetical protein